MIAKHLIQRTSQPRTSRSEAPEQKQVRHSKKYSKLKAGGGTCTFTLHVLFHSRGISIDSGGFGSLQRWKSRCLCCFSMCASVAVGFEHRKTRRQLAAEEHLALAARDTQRVPFAASASSFLGSAASCFRTCTIDYTDPC